MKATFLNSFGAVLNAVKASWIVKLAAVFVVVVPVSVAQPVSLSLDISTPYVSNSLFKARFHSDTNLPGPSLPVRGVDKVGDYVGTIPIPDNHSVGTIPNLDVCVSNLVWY